MRLSDAFGLNRGQIKETGANNILLRKRKTALVLRRGAGLVIALTVVTLVGATVSLLTLQVGALVRQRRHEQARTQAQVLIDSGIAYVEVHRDQLSQKPASETINLPVEQVFPSSASAGLTLEHLQDSTAIRIRAWAGTGQFRVCEERTLHLPTYDRKL